jgi:hypothetical protein
MSKMSKMSTTGVLTIKADKKTAGGGETYSVRTHEGVRKVKTSSASAKVMDKTVQRYAKALKRLADR